MNEILIALLIVCVILVIVYYTDFGYELSQKCNAISGMVIDTISDFFGGDLDDMYNETRGDFYNMKAKMTLKKSLAIPERQRAANDNFRIGNVYRYYVQDPNLTREYYRRTIDRIRNRPAEADHHMLDRLEDFEHLDPDLRREIPNLREMVAEDRIVQQMMNLGEVVQGRNVIVEEPRQMAQHMLHEDVNPLPPNNGPRKFQFVPTDQPTAKIVGEKNKSTYFKNLQQWTKEPQNVHDSNITSDVAKSYHLLLEGLPPKHGGNREYVDQMKAEVSRLETAKQITKDQRIKANKTIDTMYNGSVYSKIGVKEGDILVDIWRRINIPENAAKRNEMMVSFAENLATAVEKGNVSSNPVCTGGRVSRAILSLAHLDHNPEVGILKSKEVVRNEVFSNAYSEYKNALDKYTAESPPPELDPRMIKGAKDSKDGVDTPESAEFEAMVKDNIGNRIREDYSELIAKPDLDILIMESQAAF